MGMTVDKLGTESVNHFFYRELSGLLCNSTVEDYLQEHIAKLLSQMLHIITIDSIDKFVSLLDHAARNASVILFGVPGTPARPPKPFKDLDESVKFLHAVPSFVHDMHKLMKTAWHDRYGPPLSQRIHLQQTMLHRGSFFPVLHVMYTPSPPTLSLQGRGSKSVRTGYTGNRINRGHR